MEFLNNFSKLPAKNIETLEAFVFFIGLITLSMKLFVFFNIVFLLSIKLFVFYILKISILIISRKQFG